jgi:type IV pilus assembly protein PilO
MAQNLNDLTLDNIGIWPTPAKVMVIGLVCSIILLLGYWFDTRQQMIALAQASQEESDLKITFVGKAGQAANLDIYKAQVVTIRKLFNSLLQQLPERSEIPSLIEDISKIGTANGLQFDLIKPELEEDKDFYYDLPIDIVVRGSYHQLAEFVSGIAGLQRIVTLNDFSLMRSDSLQNSADKTAVPSNNLIMKITAKTFRYKEGT